MFDKWCNNCGSYNPKKRCSRCRCMLYCSKVCQKEHWIRNHKDDCGKMLKIRNDPKKGYIVIPYKYNFVSIGIFSLYVDMVDTIVMRWESSDFLVYRTSQRNIIEIISYLKQYDVEMTNSEFLLVQSGTCKTALKHRLWSDAKHKDWCHEGKALIRMWLLICQRLQVEFPLEIHFKIIPYIVADTRVCSLIRQLMFPLYGPNVYI